MVDSFTFDAADRLMGISDVKSGTTTLFAATYTRDNANQLTADSSAPTATGSYKYTTLNQVCYAGSSTASACNAPPAGSKAYAYDAADNLTQMGTTQQAFNSADELCWTAATSGACATPPTGATAYSYDTRGNRTQITPPSGGATNLSYDQANRLTAYGSAATYAYNGDGLRMSKTATGITSQFVWDVRTGLPSLIKDGSTAYVDGPGGSKLERVSGSTPLWYHHDQLGSTRLITDASGIYQATYTFDAYGKLLTFTGNVANPVLYAGQYQDVESGLYYLSARYDEPSSGQFMSSDPLVSTTRSPYGYVSGNPLNESDPAGLFGFDDVKHFVGRLAQADATIVSVLHESSVGALQLTASAVYAPYYFAYTGAKRASDWGDKHGPVAGLATRALMAPLVIPEILGIEGDAEMDWIKNKLLNNGESTCDEARVAPKLGNWAKGHGINWGDMYFPGMHSDGSIDFEW